MLIFPAIDLRAGRCVRLRQGDYAQETVFGDDPAAMARRWVDDGATWLHIVDLDGAKAGKPVNGDSIRHIVEAAKVPCQLGGGLRTEEDIAAALEWGVERIVIGTKALKAPGWFQKVCQRWPGRMVLGIDAKDGQVATEGWLEVSTISALDLARQFSASPRPAPGKGVGGEEPCPLAGIVYTDISRDGMMQGANVEAMAAMSRAVKVPVIASGGVTTLEDVGQLAQRGLAGCIIGRALYEGSLTLKQALEIAYRNPNSGV